MDERVTVTEVETLYRGLQDLAERFETRIVGGDTVYTPTITVGLTLLGTVPVGSALLRSRAEPGDLLLVTGTLGKAAAGLEILRREVSVADGIRKQVLEAHYRPWPRVQEGRILSSLGWVHALIDISDGLASEVGHLCTQSRVGVEIWWEALPIAPSTRDVARACASCPEEWALTGGEDYELLMAVPADRVEATQEALQKIGCALTAVGRIRPRDEGGTLVHPEGRWPLNFKGYDHFRS
ncbi:MAG: thiamine-phosphate kinase [Syntrophomonadaceae bacterium]|nr:thiamine-phosphate kinase [Syntrophomonadaceae bacterium]